ncbi:MAG: hypothetical protein JWO60_1142 [Frankiales bacterium]|nr:hypothetical protein [Frankiales bacterium]
MDHGQSDGRQDAALAEYEAVFRSSPTGMAVLDAEGRFVRVNEALCTFLGRDAAWLTGRSPAEVTLEQDLTVQHVLERRLRTSDRVGKVHKRYLRPDGVVVHGLVSAVSLGSAEHGRRTLAQIEDATERVRLEDELRRLATHDSLTGLPGRRLLLDRLQEALHADADGAVAVLFGDLDAFKLVNDALGHAAGDAVLQEVARRFSRVVRPEDTVGRLAGDEFLVVAPGVGDEHEARRLAERLEQSLRPPVPFGDDEIFVSCSLGVAVRGAGALPGADLADTLLADADAAMYQAKRHGKRRYEVFDAAMRSRAAERSRTAGLLRRAVADERLTVHYQPVVALPSLVPIGVEALVRVVDPDGALLAPADFLEVAEQIGVLPDLDAHVLKVATLQVQRWRSEHGLDLHLSVNAGAGQVLRSLADQVETALEASGLPADRLSVELTEQTFIDGLQAARDSLHRLVARGVNLAIDDFGTGWASLTYLRQFPVSAIKIDRSFVQGLPGSAEDSVIVGALAGLAGQLGLACVVEGVETDAQLESLLALLPGTGSFAQGFLFGRPQAAPDLLPLLLRHGRRAGDP